jgi:hypothetical protein
VQCGVTPVLKLILKILRLFDHRLDVKNWCAVDDFDWANQQAIGLDA